MHAYLSSGGRGLNILYITYFYLCQQGLTRLLRGAGSSELSVRCNIGIKHVISAGPQRVMLKPEPERREF